GGGGLVVGEVLGLIGIQPEAGGDEQKDAGAEEEAALPLQAGFAEQSLEGAVGHLRPFGTADSNGWPGRPGASIGPWSDNGRTVRRCGRRPQTRAETRRPGRSRRRSRGWSNRACRWPAS